MTVDTARLYATTDAQVWAEEFVEEFEGKVVTVDESNGVDTGLMIGWFANAIETGRSAGLMEQKAKIDKALNELGVPGPDYPAPVANAVAILRD